MKFSAYLQNFLGRIIHDWVVDIETFEIMQSCSYNWSDHRGMESSTKVSQLVLIANYQTFLFCHTQKVNLTLFQLLKMFQISAWLKWETCNKKRTVMCLPRLFINFIFALSLAFETSVSSLNIQNFLWVLVANILSFTPILDVLNLSLKIKRFSCWEIQQHVTMSSANIVATIIISYNRFFLCARKFIFSQILWISNVMSLNNWFCIESEKNFSSNSTCDVFLSCVSSTKPKKKEKEKWKKHRKFENF